MGKWEFNLELWIIFNEELGKDFRFEKELGKDFPFENNWNPFSFLGFSF